VQELLDQFANNYNKHIPLIIALIRKYLPDEGHQIGIIDPVKKHFSDTLSSLYNTLTEEGYTKIFDYEGLVKEIQAETTTIKF
jgi:hypothetical protein